MTDRKVQRRLTGAEMDRIREKIESAQVPLEALTDAVITTFDVLLGDVGSSWEQETEIRGWDYAIPSDQWQQIASWLLAFDDNADPELRVSAALEWMNKGPSAYAEVVTSCT